MLSCTKYLTSKGGFWARINTAKSIHTHTENGAVVQTQLSTWNKQVALYNQAEGQKIIVVKSWWLLHSFFHTLTVVSWAQTAEWSWNIDVNITSGVLIVEVSPVPQQRPWPVTNRKRPWLGWLFRKSTYSDTQPAGSSIMSACHLLPLSVTHFFLLLSSFSAYLWDWGWSRVQMFDQSWDEMFPSTFLISSCQITLIWCTRFIFNY